MLLAAAVAAAVVLAACLPGQSEDPGPGPGAADLPPTPDPCLLLTPDEIAAVQGGPTEAGMETFGQAPGHRACLFGQQDSPESTTISVFPGDDVEWQDTIDDVELNFEVEEIAGLGDAAFIGGWA